MRGVVSKYVLDKYPALKKWLGPIVIMKLGEVRTFVGVLKEYLKNKTRECKIAALVHTLCTGCST